MRRVALSLVIGLAVGLGIGLFFGWNLLPVQLVETRMSNLRPQFQDDYTVMVAEAYQIDGDLNEALERLRPLGISNIPTYVRDVTERYISASGTGKESDIRDLVVLSCALGYCTPPMQSFRLPTPVPTPGS